MNEMLLKTLQTFSDQYDLSIDQQYNDFYRQVDYGLIDIEKLYDEYKNGLNSTDFNWKSLARESNLLAKLENYSSNDIQIYVRYILEELITDEDKMNKKLTLLVMDQMNLKIGVEFVKIMEIYNDFKLIDEFNWLEKHHFYKLIPRMHAEYEFDRNFTTPLMHRTIRKKKFGINSKMNNKPQKNTGNYEQE